MSFKPDHSVWFCTSTIFDHLPH